MLRRSLHRLDRVIGVPSETDRDRAHLGERLCALMPRMPWVYAILVINLSGVLISLHKQPPLIVSPGVALVLFMLARLFHWVRLGGSSLTGRDVLRELRRLYVKLDGSLITSAAMGERGLALLKGVLELCRAVGLPCIAEHVETRAQATMLRELGCRFGQGFWLARPMSAARASKVAQSDVVRVAPGSQTGHWPEGPVLVRSRA
jgi:EAL domain